MHRPTRSIRFLRWAVAAGLAALVYSSIGSPAHADEASGLRLGDDDRVLFFGSNPLWPASLGLRAETFLRVKYPELKTRFYHWSPGPRATVEDGRRAYDRYLETARPTVVVLGFGLHDGNSEPARDSRLGAFRANLQWMIDVANKAGARVVLVTPNAPEPERKTLLTKSDYGETVTRYADVVRGLAAEKKLPLVDWHAATSEDAAPPGVEMTEDGLVPTPEACTIGAELLLKQWQAEPLEVVVDLDWQAAEASSGACIAQASRGGEGMTLQLRGLPIPWLVPGRGLVVRPAEPTTMSRFVLRVRNAPAGGIAITKPRGKAHAYSPAQAEEGIDLCRLREVVQTRPSATLISQIKMKNKTLDRYEHFWMKPLEGPEFAEANSLYSQAMWTEAAARARIIDKTPRVEDVTLTLAAMDAPPH